MATESEAGQAPGAGFEFTPQAIDLQLSRCSQLLEQLAADRRGVQAAQMAVHPPAPDPASVMATQAVKDLFSQADAAFQAGVEFIAGWQAKLTEAKTNYIQIEHMTAARWAELANGMEP